MDPSAQMLNHIKNSQAAQKPSVVLSFSNLKYNLLKILEECQFVEKVEKKGRGSKRTLEILLKYTEGQPAVSGFKKVSKSSQRVYIPAQKIKPIKGGQGLTIISTPQGLMTGKEARKKNLGGEVICEVW